jgi:hypothetical protein
MQPVLKIRLGKFAAKKKAANAQAKLDREARVEVRESRGEIRQQGLKAVVRRNFKSLAEYQAALRTDSELASIHGIALRENAVAKKLTNKNKAIATGKIGASRSGNRKRP